MRIKRANVYSDKSEDMVFEM